MILGLPRGGVPVAAKVAAALNAPLDLILVRKIGAPIEPDFAMGAVVDGGSPIMVRNEDVIRLAGVDEADSRASAKRTCRDRTAAPALLGQSQHVEVRSRMKADVGVQQDTVGRHTAFFSSLLPLIHDRR